MSINNQGSSGFTVVEIIVVLALCGILSALLFGPLDDLYTSSTKSYLKIVQISDTRSALHTITSQLSTAVAFTSTLSPVAPLGSKNDASPWYWWGRLGNDSSKRVIIAQVNGTDKIPSSDIDGTRQLIYDNTCGTTPVKNYRIFFVAPDPKNSLINNLYQRTITGSPCSSGPVMIQRQSCASANIAAFPSVCFANDALLLSNVSEFKVDYYQKGIDKIPLDPDSTNAHTKYSSQTSAYPASANSIVISIKTSTGSGTILQETTSSLRATIGN